MMDQMDVLIRFLERQFVSRATKHLESLGYDVAASRDGCWVFRRWKVCAFDQEYARPGSHHYCATGRTIAHAMKKLIRIVPETRKDFR